MALVIEIINGKYTVNGKQLSELNQVESKFLNDFFREIKEKESQILKRSTMNLDDFKTGLHDSQSPINQKEEPQQIESITDAFEIGTSEDFYNRVSEVQTRINRLRELYYGSDNEFIKKQLTIIYNLL